MNTIYNVSHNTILWFGRYKGKPLKSIPAKYLLAISKYDNLPCAIKKYLKDNLEILKKEQFENKPLH